MSTMKGGARALGRQGHSDQIYRLIRSSQGITRGALAAETGLSISTIGHALNTLVDNGLIFAARHERKGPGSGSGRPAAVYRAVPRGLFTGVLDFGHRHLNVAIGDDLGDALAEARLAFEVDVDAESALNVAAAELERLQRALGIEQLSVVVAGIPWPLRRRRGQATVTSLWSDWVGVDPAAELQHRLTAPVRIENDAALGAVGERAAGAGAHQDDFVYVKAAHGVGVGFVLNGELYTGATGLAGEIVHLPLRDHRELCHCGRRGCLATVWATGLQARLRTAQQNPDVAGASGPGWDETTERLLASAGRTLGEGLATVCALLNPSAVIVGGTLGESGAAFVGGVEDAIKQAAPAAIAAELEVLPGLLGARAEMVGALHRAALLAAADASGTRPLRR